MTKFLWQAEAQLNQFSLQHGFGVALLEILLSSGVDEQLRQLAAVLCRQYIHVAAHLTGVLLRGQTCVVRQSR